MRKQIDDSRVFHIWRCESTKEEFEIPPTYYEENGTPIGEDGEDMVYVRTEIEE